MLSWDDFLTWGKVESNYWMAILNLGNSDSFVKPFNIKEDRYFS